MQTVHVNGFKYFIAVNSQVNHSYIQQIFTESCTAQVYLNRRRLGKLSAANTHELEHSRDPDGVCEETDRRKTKRRLGTPGVLLQEEQARAAALLSSGRPGRDFPAGVPGAWCGLRLTRSSGSRVARP